MEIKMYENVVRPPQHRVGGAGGRKGIYAEHFNKLGVGVSFKILFKSTNLENQEKEVRAFRTAVLNYKNKHERVNLVTWPVTEEQAATNHDPVLGAGIWVKREADLTDEELDKRNTRRKNSKNARLNRKTV